MISLDSLPLSPAQAILVFGAIVLGILLSVTGLYNLAAESRHRAEAKVNRRLELLAHGTDPRAVLAILKRTFNEEPAWTRAIPGYRWLSRHMAQAGMSMSVARLMLIMAALTVVWTVLVAFIARLPIVVVLPLGAIIGIGAPVLLVLRRERKRLQRFAEQLPDAIDLLVRSLRVGHPLSAACQMVAEEMPDPIGTEFGLAVDEMTYGLDLNEAINNLSARIPVADLQYLTVAVNIQYGTGGNLAEILHGLGKVIRDRFHMYRKVRAVSAEGRMAATFLTFFPPLVVVGIFLIHRDYYMGVADHPLFHILAAIGGFLVLMNSIVMRWLTNIKV